MRSWLSSAKIYLKPGVLAQFFLGIPSGLPLALTAATLGYWLKDAGLTNEQIGKVAFITSPYTLKFLWAPLMDGSRFPLFGAWLGRRRGWMLATHLAMIGALLLMSQCNPADHLPLLELYGFLLAFASASHDIVKDAYRVEILPVEEQGAGAACFVQGYRIGMLISGAGALYLSSAYGWGATYMVMALVLAVFMPMIFLIREPEVQYSAVTTEQRSIKEWLKQYVATPLLEFMSRPQAGAILFFILLYRLTDGFMGAMAGPFYKDLGFSNVEIAQVVKLYGLVATIAGSFIGGAMVYRLGVIRSLWIGGIASALSNLMFVWQAGMGADTHALAMTVSLDNLSAGLATAAFVAYMSQLCNMRFTATQYALLSSLMATGRTWLSMYSGALQTEVGWEMFFIFSTLIVIPALIILWRLTANAPPGASTLK